MAGKKVKAIVRPGASTVSNARRIVAARTEAFFALEHSVGNRDTATELHEMRIAAKRLRYAMELFASALGPDVDWCIDAVKEFQEIVGEIHDADVRAAMLHEYLRGRAGAETDQLIALATEDAEDARALKTRMRAAASAKEWVAEQVALATAIHRTLAGRQERFAHLQERWAAWRVDRLRERLDALSRPGVSHREKSDAISPPPPPDETAVHAAS